MWLSLRCARDLFAAVSGGSQIEDADAALASWGRTADVARLFETPEDLSTDFYKISMPRTKHQRQESKLASFGESFSVLPSDPSIAVK